MQQNGYGNLALYDFTTILLGSPVILTLPEPDAELAQKVFQRIRQYERALTVNAATSQVMSINHAAGQSFVTVHPEVYALVEYAKTMSLWPGSSFNVAIGPLVRCWKIGFGGHRVPLAAEIDTILPLTDPRDIVLHPTESAVMLAKAGMFLDLGAIAKGFIADRIRDWLVSYPLSWAMINLGGNIQTLGQPAGGWRIGIKKPFTESETVGMVLLKGTTSSVATTGVYERYTQIDGKMVHHILNSRTGYPLDNDLLSVSVVAQDSVDADVWGTILYGMGGSQALAFLQTPVAERLGLGGVLVFRDNTIATAGILDYQTHE